MKRLLVVLPLLMEGLALGAHPFRLVVNEDNDRFFMQDASLMTREALCAHVDALSAGGQVSHIFFCPCGQPANYDSKVWEPVWARLDDPAYREMAKRRPLGARWPENLKSLHDRGIDPYAVWIAHSRTRGVSPWLSMRMNDVHFTTHRTLQPLRSVRFWREHHEWHRHPEWDVFDPAHREWKFFALDYAQPAVREYALAMARELIERYRPDGLELDWMRYVCHLTPGHERERASCLTDFMRAVRRIADVEGRKAGRRIGLAARIPSRYEHARDLGYDPETWAKEGLCDLFVVCNKDAADFGCDVSDWSRRLAPAAVIPGMDRFDCTHHERVYTDLAGYRGWADAMAERGAEGLYLFNATYLPKDVQEELWRTGLAGETVANGPRRYIASYPDAAPDDVPEESLCQLPRALSGGLTLEIFAGRARAEKTVSVVLSFDREVAAENVRLTLNGTAPLGMPEERRHFGKRYGDPKFSKFAWSWRFPLASVCRDRNVLEVGPLASSSAQVHWAEVALDERP